MKKSLTPIFSRCLSRLLVVALGLFYRVASVAQGFPDDNIDGNTSRQRNVDDVLEIDEELLDYSPIRISWEDIVIVIVLLIACYVFGKIWKGCSYLIIVAAVIFYYLCHNRP